MSFDVTVLRDASDAIVHGVGITLVVSGSAMACAIGLGLMAALGQSLPWRLVRFGVRAYVELFRNTPLLIQLYVFYKAFPHLGLTMSPMACGIAALSLQSGAYLAEIFRAGLDAIPRQQLEGGLSLGLSRWSVYRLLLIPQAYRLVLPAVGNQVTSIIKNSAQVAFITVPDLFWVVYDSGATQFRYLEFFTLGIMLYTVLCLIATGVVQALEKAAGPLTETPEQSYA